MLLKPVGEIMIADVYETNYSVAFKLENQSLFSIQSNRIKLVVVRQLFEVSARR